MPGFSPFDPFYYFLENILHWVVFSFGHRDATYPEMQIVQNFSLLQEVVYTFSSSYGAYGGIGSRRWSCVWRDMAMRHDEPHVNG